MENKENHIADAERIGNYLLGISISDSEKQTYALAMEKLNIHLNNYEQALWSEMLMSKSRMAFLDAGLALKDPNNNARRKLFTMLAILEASPTYTDYFLSRNFSGGYLFKIIGVGTRAICRGVIGIVLVNKIKKKCN